MSALNIRTSPLIVYHYMVTSYGLHHCWDILQLRGTLSAWCDICYSSLEFVSFCCLNTWTFDRTNSKESVKTCFCSEMALLFLALSQHQRVQLGYRSSRTKFSQIRAIQQSSATQIKSHLVWSSVTLQVKSHPA